MELDAIVLAPPLAEERRITGLTLAERGRRVCVRAGIDAARVHVVRSVAELPARLGAALLLVDATQQVVAAELVLPLELAEPGVRIAVDPLTGRSWAGAVRADGARAEALLTALRAGGDLAAGATKVVAGWLGEPGAEAVEVGRRARHPVATAAERKAADAWQFELVNKPLDSWLVVYFYRPLARPLTRLFLRSPFTPNMITVFSSALSLTGCAIAAGASWTAHVLGLALLVVGGIVDANDGEVARLRLEGSKLGGWLDAIGDDLARAGLLLAVGAHVAARHAQWPIGWITGGALAATLTTLALIYWYCIFVIHSSNNQDYTAVLGVGPGVAGAPQQRSFGRVLGDWGAQVARRDFMDLGVLGLALLDRPEISFVGLVLGAAIGLVVVVPTHLKIVKRLRAGDLPGIPR